MCKAEGENFTVTARNEAAEVSAAGTVAAITPGDDRREKVHYKYRALILYSSMTGNTEKIAVAMKEALEHYCFQVDLMKITSKLNIPRDFSSYDLSAWAVSSLQAAPPRSSLISSVSAAAPVPPQATPLIGTRNSMQTWISVLC